MKIDEIETPALLLDMDAMESNLGKMAAFFAQSGAKLRPHFKNHKCPALALRQLAAGAIGMTCATVAEAESLVRHGVHSVLIANEIADPIKIGRFIALASQADVMVCVDNEAVVEAIATAGQEPEEFNRVFLSTSTSACTAAGFSPESPLFGWQELWWSEVCGFEASWVMRVESECMTARKS